MVVQGRLQAHLSGETGELAKAQGEGQGAGPNPTAANLRR